MSLEVKISSLSEYSTSRRSGRLAARALPMTKEIELHLDREPSLSFLDGLVRELRANGRLDDVTFVPQTGLVRRHLARFLAHDPTLEIWVVNAQGRRARIEPADDEPLEVEDGPIGEDVAIGD